jgi:hypothetical protein
MDAGEWAINNSNANILMIAPTERQAYALFDKMLSYLVEKYPEKIKLGKDKPTKSEINLTNNTIIYCLPVGTSGLGVRFLTIHRLYIDEASRIPEDVWTAITPSLLTTGGDTIMLSSPFGKQGEFYKCWINKDGVYDSFTRFSCSSEQVMKEREISDTWTEEHRVKSLRKLEQEKARMSNREYMQEYMGQFMDNLFRYFSPELIKKCCTGKRISYNRKYKAYGGADLARLGEDLGAYATIIKEHSKMYRHIAHEISRKKLTNETEEIIINLDKIYNYKEYNIDAGAGTLGVSIFDHLLQEPQMSRKIKAINNRTRALNKDMNQHTRLMKEDLYSCLLGMMERGQIELLDDDEIIASLSSVQYEYIIEQGKPTIIHIFGDYTHSVEAIIRALWGAYQDKSLNIWCE